MNLFKPEVLSPVGNKDMLYAAVRAGADGVYLGAKDFNARRNADNFDNTALKEAIDYCHIRGVKVYLALNIQLNDSETEKALELSKEVYNMGIDALIIADLGLARLLHEKLPLLPLHASTQMTVCDKSALSTLKKLGFSRVVAAREMSENELRELCSQAKKLDIEIEVFVHGALCMSVSGQCLLSALIGSRSGNRGLCAGPCRLPYSDSFGNDYTLSLKDLSLLHKVKSLKEMGVASLKIEGRMKRSEYVAAATATFRNMVDNGFVDHTLKSCVENVFSRSGFTDGYFTNQLGKDMFGIRTKEDVTLAPDTYPFLHEMIRRERQSVPVKIYAQIKKNKPVRITFDDNKNKAVITGDVPEEALNRPISEEFVRSQLSKLGSTPYFAASVDIILDDGLMVRAGQLNELRRNVCELLSKMRCKTDRKNETFSYQKATANKELKSPSLWVRVDDVSLLPKDLRGISAVILPIEKDHDLSALPKNITAVADIPRINLFGEQLEKRLEYAQNSGFSAALVQNIGHFEAVRKTSLSIFSGIGMNIFSSESLATLKELGVEWATLSPELYASQIQKIQPHIKTACFAYGRLPLMLTKNCPASFEGCKGCKGDRFLTDRKGIKFPVKCRMGYSELLNDRPIYIADRLGEFNVDSFILYFTDENASEIKNVINCYKNASPPPFTFTRGLYYRGVE
ncbi:MAG: U32 family peptidase [Acutalibacteraceae bacterium]|nr:U32 family peptidase [Acutalibacteraceae bacterium]